MRKSIFFITIVMLMALLASCSREEDMNAPEKSGNVSVSAELPQAIVSTRAQITIGADHKLRCILEVWSQEEIPALKYRQEVAVAVGTTPAFNFTLESGDYDCLIWADYIKTNASVTKVTADGVEYNHHEDTYYNTSDLRSITIKDEAGANLFDTDNCDAFFSTQHLVKKEDETLVISFRLERPFAKLIVKEQDAKSFATLTKMNIYYSIPKGFNVAMGEPTDETTMATFEKTFQENDSRVLFTHYIFAPGVGEKTLGAVTLALTTTTKRNCAIPEKSITLKRNQCTNASGKLIAGGGIDPEPDPDPDEDRNPIVGDYFFSDGTWSATLTALNKDKCVGIVYAIESQQGDKLEDYGATGSGKSIKGYVVSLNPLEATFEVTGTNGCGSNVRSLYMYNKNKSDFISYPSPSGKNNDMTNNDGYANTKYLFPEPNQFKPSAGLSEIIYPALQCFYDWQNSGGGKAISNTSGWYIPSARQMLNIVGGFYGFTPPTGGNNDLSSQTSLIEQNAILREALDAAKALKIAEEVLLSSGGTLFSSSLSDYKTGVAATPIHLQFSGSGTITRIKEGNGNKEFVVRPILTILK